MIHDTVQIRPKDGLLTDRDLKRLKRLYREHGQSPRAFYVKPSERRRMKRAAAEFRRKNPCP